MVEVEGGESVQDLSNVDVVHLIDFDEVLDQHEDHVGEESGISAEVGVLESVEYLRNKSLKVFVIFEDILNGQLFDLVADPSETPA